jgi:hypothetical protein
MGFCFASDEGSGCPAPPYSAGYGGVCVFRAMKQSVFLLFQRETGYFVLQIGRRKRQSFAAFCR